MPSDYDIIESVKEWIDLFETKGITAEKCVANMTHYLKKIDEITSTESKRELLESKPNFYARSE